MKINQDMWRERKYKAWKRILDDLEIGYLDVDLLPLLVLINRDRELYTTSSCSGRITVMDAEYPWEKEEETAIVFKTHAPVKPSELSFLYSKTPYRKFWIIVNGPIIHIYTANLKLAVKILEQARRVGFKHSGIMHYSRNKGVFLELVTGVYTAQVIRVKNEAIVKPSELPHLVEVVNSTLLEGKERLEKLYRELEKILPVNPDPYIEREIITRNIQVNKSPLEVLKEVYKDRF